MEPVEIITVIVIGALAGWLGSLFFKKGLGLIGNIIVGILGCIFGSWLFFEVLDVKKNFLFTGDYRARNPLVFVPEIPKWIRKLELIMPMKVVFTYLIMVIFETSMMMRSIIK